jgi:hypothetical protein
MTKKTDKGTDRRSVIAAATAASVIATPFAAKAASSMMARGKPTVIRVDLGGVSLSEREAASLSAEIRRSVLAAVARQGIKVQTPQFGPHPGWYGIVLAPLGEGAYEAR